MAEFKNESLGLSFTLPDKPTVRQQMTYMSEAAFAFGKQRFEQYWLGAVAIVQDWKCDLVPDPARLNLDEATDPRVADIVMWVGWEVKEYITRLDNVPKN